VLQPAAAEAVLGVVVWAVVWDIPAGPPPYLPGGAGAVAPGRQPTVGPLSGAVAPPARRTASEQATRQGHGCAPTTTTSTVACRA
jgi:hypothetical protein